MSRRDDLDDIPPDPKKRSLEDMERAMGFARVLHQAIGKQMNSLEALLKDDKSEMTGERMQHLVRFLSGMEDTCQKMIILLQETMRLRTADLQGRERDYE